MHPFLFYPISSADSCRYASGFLEKAGISITDHPTPEITHLLLDVPSFDADGNLRDGTDLRQLLRMLPKAITLIGGNINCDFTEDYRRIDLLKDPGYLAKNAAITAECALQAAGPYINTTFADSHALILGWGRIGKCLSKLLCSIGCTVTVAARKEHDRAMLNALGFPAIDFNQIPQILPECAILFNTVPNAPLHRDLLCNWKGISIDLASYPGLDGDGIIPARGLPGKYAPKTSGKLIAETILRLI